MKDDQDVKTIREGKATIIVPRGAEVGEDQREVQKVFYNPIQQYNRDLSVLAIKTYGEIMHEKRCATRNERPRNQKKRKRPVGEDDAPAQTSTNDAADNEAAPGAGSDPTAPSMPSKFKILDALSASGLRALRYAHEIPFASHVVANDLSETAAEAIRKNVQNNGLEDRVTVANEDALAYMYRFIADGLANRDKRGNVVKKDHFDVIDLDPYGTAAPFFDAAVQSVRDDGGLLCVTCTDSAIWAGHSYAEKTYALYGGIPTKGLHAHESGLRLILHAIATSAARYGLAIEPQLSLSIDYYTKVFVRVVKSQHAVKFLGAKTMLVYNCDQGCGAWETQRLMQAKETPNKNKSGGTYYKHIMSLGPTTDVKCAHCGWKMHLAGPMYAGHLHSRDFVERLEQQVSQADPSVYGTLKRLQGMLHTVKEEFIPFSYTDESPAPTGDAALADYDKYPFFIMTGKLSHTLSCATPPFDSIRGALKHLGYQVGRSHCRPGSIKTDAPWSVVWYIMTEWIRQKSPIKPENVKPTTPGYRILQRAGLVPEAESQQLGAEKKENGTTEQEEVVRYQMNPEVNWGPLTKASRR
ncbi:S-adenosyl-L-methionine-dependent methyltransferase [Stachybotrys elegans]|uniref:tRNA (guanine(26)-N(2))-dimethyltransferase n=1 Tax=Stachybotrys elegans TaxID=80388 RepID=A0A8K0WXW8_9HYPO|nr:S-adenosyl-L-methionine-dependent methyltransferase [Stachybotrys elegans]